MFKYTGGCQKKSLPSKMGRLVYDGYKIKKMLTEVMFLYSHSYQDGRTSNNCKS